MYNNMGARETLVSGKAVGVMEDLIKDISDKSGVIFDSQLSCFTFVIITLVTRNNYIGRAHV